MRALVVFCGFAAIGALLRDPLSFAFGFASACYLAHVQAWKWFRPAQPMASAQRALESVQAPEPVQVAADTQNSASEAPSAPAGPTFQERVETEQRLGLALKSLGYSPKDRKRIISELEPKIKTGAELTDLVREAVQLAHP